MSYLINNQQKMNDIVFAGRNKNYGAYAIRSTYGNTLFKSLMFVISGFGACILGAYILSDKNEPAPDLIEQILPMDIIRSIEVDLTPKQKIPPAASASSDKPAAKQPELNTASTVADSVPQQVKDPVLPSEADPNAVSSASASQGANSSSTVAIIDKSGGDKKTGDDVKHIYGVDTQPEFEGGLAALHRFLATNMRYPDAGSDAGKEATVHVEFVVNENGKVSDLKLQNKSGYGFDEEALRVVRLIPDFKKPAMVDGKPVKVYYQLPIKFRMH